MMLDVVSNIRTKVIIKNTDVFPPVDELNIHRTTKLNKPLNQKCKMNVEL